MLFFQASILHDRNHIKQGRTGAEAEAPILWPLDVKSQLTGKDPDARKDWGQQEKGAAEDEMVGGITDSMDMNLDKLQGKMVTDRETWHAAVHVHKELDTTF